MTPFDQLDSREQSRLVDAVRDFSERGDRSATEFDALMFLRSLNEDDLAFWRGKRMSRTVTITRTQLDAFCAQWPCHGIPTTLASITFEFADNGDLVDIVAKSRNGRVVDSASFDGPALVALSQDAQAQEPETPVLFRKMTPRYGGDVLAVFPCDAASYKVHECGSYAHVGQHGACDPWHVIKHSHPATPAEYADLKAELEGAPYHYRFRVYTRMQGDWLEVRRKVLAQHGAKLPPASPCRDEAIGRLSHGN